MAASGPRVPASMLAALDDVAAEVTDRIGAELPAVARLFRATFGTTLETTVRPQDDGTVFVITGDIPAMWLRDSAAQVRPYLLLAASDPAFADLLVGVVRRQFRLLVHDPYANAFNETASGAAWDTDDESDRSSPWVWERKFELDSHCYPFLLASSVWRATGRTDHLDADFVAALRTVLATWAVEVDHDRSPYRFRRPGQGLSHRGRGAPVGRTGMVWSGFRPSDDACERHYHVPGNAFAAVTAGLMAELLGAVAEPVLDGAERRELTNRAEGWAVRLRTAVGEHAVVPTPDGPILAYEVDGRGGAVLMDDANVPSLLSLPYLGWCAPDDELYAATRRFVLSPANPYYYSGRVARGVGSPHLGSRPRVWPLALAMQGLTATDPAERVAMLQMLAATDAGTGLMHEEFHVDDPTDYTRPWFGWANALFSELVLSHAGLTLPGVTAADPMAGARS